MKQKIKVLVVDDSAFMRKLITDFLSEDPRIIVVGTARNGADCLAKIETYSPDVITMDVEMPIMDGIEALKEIMNKNPKPVIMLSSTTSVGAENTIISLQEGAFDFVAKPSGPISIDIANVKFELIEKIIASCSSNITKLKGQTRIPLSSVKRTEKDVEAVRKTKLKKQQSIVCIGTSTGGPKALQSVLMNLPKEIGAPILIVQHMPKGFTSYLARRLNTISPLPVKEAEEGEIVKNDYVYIAPSGFHLEVIEENHQLVVSLQGQVRRNGHKPSVDVMLESIKELKNHRKIVVIMTGMGTDGTEGLKILKSSNCNDVFAISESENTSVIYGMPKSAVSTNLVDVVADLDQIPESIMKFL